MPDVTLSIYVGGSALSADLGDLRPWTPLLNNADSIGLVQDGTERVRVELSGLRRWVAFRRQIGGSPFAVVGHQETVGAICRGDAFIGGSNRKMLAWVHLGTGRVFIGEQPE